MADFLTGPLALGHRPPRAGRGGAAGPALRGAELLGARASGWPTPSESLAHGLLPGLVLAALAGAPLLVGAGGRRGRGRRGRGAGRPRRADRLGHRHRRGGQRRVRARRAAGAGARDAPRGWRSCCSATRSACPTPTWPRPPRWPWRGGLALAALHRPLAAVAFDAGGARRAGPAPAARAAGAAARAGHRGGRGGAGPGQPAGAGRAGGPGRGRPATAAQPGAGDGRRGGRGGRGGRRRPLLVAPPGRRRRGLGGAGAVRGAAGAAALVRRLAAPAPRATA